MSTANLVGHQDEKKGSISRGRGKGSNLLNQATQIQENPSGSKSESQSKTSDKSLTTRASRYRGWKRPDQAIYVPRALQKRENNGQSTENCRGEDKACQLRKKDEDIFAESDSFPEQESADRHHFARRYPEKDKTGVSVASSENQNCCDISDEKRAEANGLSVSSAASDLCNTEVELLDIIPRSVYISDLKQECHKKKTLSKREIVSEIKPPEKFPSTGDTSEKSCPERNEKEVEQDLQKGEDKTQIGSTGGAEELQVIDRCLSKPLVTPYADKERNGQKEQSSLENQDVIESTNLEQQKPVVDTWQSNSSVEDDNDNEIALKCQDMLKNVIGGEEKQQCLISSANLVSDEPVAEGGNMKKEEQEFLEEFSKGLVEIEPKREEEQSQATDASELLSNNAEMKAEILYSCEVYPQEHIRVTLSEDANDVETDSMNDEICCQECSKETSTSNISNNILDHNILHEILNDPSEQNQLGEYLYRHEVTSDVKDNIKKNESLSQKQEGERESDNITNQEIQGSTKAEQRKNLSDLDVGTKEEGKVESNEVVNNEMLKEAKQKKKTKKKKGEENSKEEKKKRKSKKKESENEESKEKEMDEKHKLKKKEKKKANKEYSGTKSKESKSREKAKEKKEEICKKGNESNNEDESWESKFDEDGECLDPELLDELTEATGIKKPSRHKTQFDYYSLPVKDVTLDDVSGYGHIVELYDFSSELKTQDLVQLLSSFKSQGYEIKWVDDTHALAVFASEIAAKQAIQMCSSPIMKLRPVSQGTPESKSKAKKCFDFLQPYKPRPQTTNLAAHRLVTGALGVRSTMSKEEREREKEKIKEAKEQKRQEKQRKADIWGD